MSKHRLSDRDLEIERGRCGQTWTEREQRSVSGLAFIVSCWRNSSLAFETQMQHIIHNIIHNT